MHVKSQFKEKYAALSIEKSIIYNAIAHKNCSECPLLQHSSFIVSLALQKCEAKWQYVR